MSQTPRPDPVSASTNTQSPQPIPIEFSYQNLPNTIKPYRNGGFSLEYYGLRISELKGESWGLIPIGYANINHRVLPLENGAAWVYPGNQIRLLISKGVNPKDTQPEEPFYPGRITLYIGPETGPPIDPLQPAQFVSTITGELATEHFMFHTMPGYPLRTKTYQNEAEFIVALSEYHLLIQTSEQALLVEAALRRHNSYPK